MRSSRPGRSARTTGIRCRSARRPAWSTCPRRSWPSPTCTTRSSQRRRSASTSASTSTAVMMPDDPQVRAAALATVRGALKAWDPVTQTEKLARRSIRARGTAACSRPPASWSSRATSAASSSRTTRRTARSCGRSRRRPASSPRRDLHDRRRAVRRGARRLGRHVRDLRRRRVAQGRTCHQSQSRARIQAGRHCSAAGTAGGCSARETAGARRRRATRTSRAGRVPYVLLDVSRRLRCRRRRACPTCAGRR